MSILSTDEFGFLTPQNTPAQESKTFTIKAGGETRTASDHPVVVLHKNNIKQTQWKDLGNTMQLIRLVPNRIKEINENTDMSPGFINALYSVLTWYEGYDEINNQHYYYIPKIAGSKLVGKLDSIDLFCEWSGSTILDEQKGRFTIHPQEQNTNNNTYILAEFLGLCFLYGKPTIKNNVLISYKLQIPNLRFDIINKVETIIDRMRSFGFVLHINHQEGLSTIEITTNDYMVLAYIRILLGEQIDVILVDKILEIQQKIFIHYGVTADQQSMRWQLYEVKR